MACQSTGCVKRYQYERVAHYARKRYVEGIATVVLLCRARAEDEKQLIVLASMLDVDDEKFQELMPSCNCRCRHRMLEFRERLRIMLEAECRGRRAA